MCTVAGMAKRPVFWAPFGRHGAFAYRGDIRDVVVRAGLRVDESA